MLVLSRKLQEEIVIGGNIRITVVEVAGGRVKLGITAPSEIPVHRAEIHGRIRHPDVSRQDVVNDLPLSMPGAAFA